MVYVYIYIYIHIYIYTYVVGLSERHTPSSANIPNGYLFQV